MAEQAPVIWGSINIGMMCKWYPLCIKYLMRCPCVPRLAVVLEAEPLDDAIKREIQKATNGVMDWVFVSHCMPKINNINNDNARNLRFLIPKIDAISRADDLIALIEQDVIICKKDWISVSQKLLTDLDIVTAAGAYTGENSRSRRNKPKPYFSIFKSTDAAAMTAAVKTNRGSFVTINVPTNRIYRLDKHVQQEASAHAFGSDSEFWAIHARGGSNHNGRADKSLEYFSSTDPKRLKKRIRRYW